MKYRLEYVGTGYIHGTDICGFRVDSDPTTARLVEAFLAALQDRLALGAEKLPEAQWPRQSVAVHLDHALRHGDAVDWNNPRVGKEDHLAAMAVRAVMALAVRGGK